MSSWRGPLLPGPPHDSRQDAYRERGRDDVERQHPTAPRNDAASELGHGGIVAEA